MFIELSSQEYSNNFQTDPHPFVSKDFIELNRGKVDSILRISEEGNKPGIGLVAGLRDGMILSPFSAPFGGFHFRKEIMFSEEIDNAIESLKLYLEEHQLKGIEITLPPDIYHRTFNAKIVNAFLRKGFNQQLPEITNYVDLLEFKGKFSQRNSKEYYKQAIRNGLKFQQAFTDQEKELAYTTIYDNRKKFGRPIHMSFKDIVDTSALWQTDFFIVQNPEEEVVASAIMYRSHPDICYAVFWGDNEVGRPLRAMDFLAFHLWSFYKDEGFKYIDLGNSTEDGVPNQGLLRFKESHEATSSLKHRFTWYTSPSQL